MRVDDSSAQALLEVPGGVGSRRGSTLASTLGMKVLPNLFGRASSVQADHEHLKHTWARLRELTGAQGGVVSDQRTWDLVRGFAAELLAHFSAEETDYFVALRDEQPALAPRIEHLQADHAAIRGLLAELLALEARSRNLEQPLRVVLDRLEKHEHAETTLLQEFFGRVHGGEG
jgi:hypothetical protein